MTQNQKKNIANTVLVIVVFIITLIFTFSSSFIVGDMLPSMPSAILAAILMFINAISAFILGYQYASGKKEEKDEKH